jgi:hypothetical protein
MRKKRLMVLADGTTAFKWELSSDPKSNDPFEGVEGIQTIGNVTISDGVEVECEREA